MGYIESDLDSNLLLKSLFVSTHSDSLSIFVIFLFLDSAAS